MGPQEKTNLLFGRKIGISTVRFRFERTRDSGSSSKTGGSVRLQASGGRHFLFRGTRARCSASLAERRGQIHDIRMITASSTPLAGTVSVGGFDIADNPIAARRLIGYLPRNAPAYTDMTVHGVPEFAPRFAAARRRRKRRPSTGGGNVLSRIGCCIKAGNALQRLTATAPALRESIIQIRRAGAGRADRRPAHPNQKHEVRGLIRRMGASKAIIFSTHNSGRGGRGLHGAIIIDRAKSSPTARGGIGAGNPRWPARSRCASAE